MRRLFEGGAYSSKYGISCDSLATLSRKWEANDFWESLNQAAGESREDPGDEVNRKSTWPENLLPSMETTEMCDASPSQGYLQQYVAGFHFIQLDGERQRGVKFLVLLL